MSTETNSLYSNPEIWGGIECTVNRVNDVFRDQLEDGGHYERQNDIPQIAALGFKKLRYPILWEKHQPDADGRIEWDRVTNDLNTLRSSGVTPIAGLLHHGSGPAGTSLLDDDFPEKFSGYALTVARQFPWLQYYTPINEPLTTARFSGLYGFWYPHQRNDRCFLKMLLNQVKATVLAMQAIRTVNPNALLIQTEDLGKTHSTPALAYQAVFENHRRWLSYDLLCGSVLPGHPLWEYIISCGIREDELLFFRDHPCKPAIIGCNYYLTSERWLDECTGKYPLHTHGGNCCQQYADIAAVQVNQRAGLKRLLEEVWDRYKIPLAVTECHLNCTREEQLRWLHETWLICCGLKKNGIPVKAVTVWSLLGAHDWDCLLVENNGRYETGTFDIRTGLLRPTALAKMISTLAAQQPFEHPLLEQPGWWLRSNHSSQVTGRPLLIIGETHFAEVCIQRGIPFRFFSAQEFFGDYADNMYEYAQRANAWGLVTGIDWFLPAARYRSIGPATPVMLTTGGTVPENVDPGAAQEMLIVQNKCGNGTKFAHDAMDLFIDEEKGLWILSDHAIRKGRIRKPDRLSNQINF